MNKVKQKIVPALRFPDFENNWKDGVISDLADTVMGNAFKSKDFVNEGIQLIRMGNLYAGKLQLDRNPKFLPKDFRNKYPTFLLKPNDILMSMTGTIDKRDYGFVIQIPENSPNLLLNQRVVKIIPKANCVDDFLLQLLKSEEFLNILYSQAGGTKQANLSIGQLKNIEILFPNDPKEQEKIANCLSSLDTLITAEAEKLDQLKDHKKGLLQQLFPAKGETKPQFRFPEFENDGDWDEKMLGDEDVSIIIMGSSPKSSFYNKDNIGLPLLQGNADIKNRLSVPRIFTSQITKECTINDILLSVRAPVGTVAKSLHQACIGRGISAIRAVKPNSQEYLYQWLLSFEPYWKNISQGGTFDAVNSDDIKKLLITIPSPKEQQKIANCLSSADDLIEEQTSKIIALKAHKKGLMQQLFPSINS